MGDIQDNYLKKCEVLDENEECEALDEDIKDNYLEVYEGLDDLKATSEKSFFDAYLKNSIKDCSTICLCLEKNLSKVYDYYVISKIGSGSFGNVFFCKNLKDNNFYAVKKIDINCSSFESLFLERDILLYNHLNKIPFLLHLKDFFVFSNHFYYVTDFAVGNTLFHVLNCLGGRFSPNVALFYLVEMICGISYLHSINIIHMDLKLQNIFFDNFGHILIGDFGICTFGFDNSKIGTYNYAPPEVLQNFCYRRDVNWWNLGIILYLMLFKQFPFKIKNENYERADILKTILENELTFPEEISHDLNDFLNRLLEKNPNSNKRFGILENSWKELMEHRVFSFLDWKKVFKKEIFPPIVFGFCKPILTNSVI